MNKPDREFVLQQAARLEQESQDAVMHDIAQFAEAEIVKTYAGGVPRTPALHPLVFNMERGVCLAETVDFLTDCPDIQPYDLILANELDFGCARSGERDTTAEIAKTLGMEYVFGLEFIELADAALGFHGNAVFSRWPITWAEVFRLPEQYNWYNDRQKRIGGRNAIFVKLDVGGQEVGAVSIHLENRTDGAGRRVQMKAVLDEVERVFPGIPVVLGGDLTPTPLTGATRRPSSIWASTRRSWRQPSARRMYMSRFCRTARRPVTTGRRPRATAPVRGASRCRRAAILICGWTGCCLAASRWRTAVSFPR